MHPGAKHHPKLHHLLPGLQRSMQWRKVKSRVANLAHALNLRLACVLQPMRGRAAGPRTRPRR